MPVLFLWPEDDPVDQATHQFHSLGPALLIIEGLDQVRHLIPVKLRHVRVQAHRLFGCFGEHGFQFGLAGFEFSHPVLHAAAGHAIEDGLDKSVEITAHLAKPAAVALRRGAALRTQAVHVARVLLAEDFGEGRVHQMIAQPVQDAGLDEGPLDRQQIIAGPLGPGGRAAHPVMRVFDEAAAARAALQQPGKQITRAAAVLDPHTFP